MTFGLGASVPHSKRRRVSGEKRRESFFELVRTRSEGTAQRRRLRRSLWHLEHVHPALAKLQDLSVKTQDSKGGSFKPPLGQCGRRAHDLDLKVGLGGSPRSAVWAASPRS